MLKNVVAIKRSEHTILPEYLIEELNFLFMNQETIWSNPYPKIG